MRMIAQIIKHTNTRFDSFNTNFVTKKVESSTFIYLYISTEIQCSDHLHDNDKNHLDTLYSCASNLSLFMTFAKMHIERYIIPCCRNIGILHFA